MTRSEKLNRKAIEYSLAIKDFMTMHGAKEESAKTIAKMVQLAYMAGAAEVEKDVAEAFAIIIRGNLGGIENGIQNMFEQLYTEITGEKMYKGFKD